MNDFTPEEIAEFEERLKREQQRQQVGAMTHVAVPEEKVTGTPHMIEYVPGQGFRQVSAPKEFMASIGAGAKRAATNLGEMFGVVPTEKAKAELERLRPFTQGPFRGTGAFIGETGVLAPVSEAAGGLFAAGARPFGYGGALTRGTVESGLSGAAAAEPGERRTGAAFGAAMNLPLSAAGKFYRTSTRGIETIDKAKDLAQRGVTLTPGQMNPEGTFAMLEEAAMGIPFLSPRITKARQQGWRETQAVIAQEAAPPGFKITPKEDVHEMFNEIYNAYTPAYSVAKGFPVSPVIMTPGANRSLYTDLPIGKKAVADSESRNYVNNFIDNQLSYLRSKGAKMTSDDLLEVRSNIRDEVRKLSSRQNAPFKAVDLLEGAEKKVTDALESQLPQDAIAALKEVDSRYGNLKIFEKAIKSAKDRPEGFTPAQFSQAVQQGVESNAKYAAGGGRMRDISSAAAEVFPNRQPMTGRQVPGQIVGTAAGLATYPIYGQSKSSTLIRQLLSGSRPEQQAIQKVEDAFKRKLSQRERDALVSILRSGAGVYGAQQQPNPFATTAEQ